MSNNTSKQAIHDRLRAFFDAIITEASENPTFYAKLEEILLSEDVKLKLRSDKEPKKKHNTPPNIISILHNGGESGLKEFLDNQTNEQLLQICAQEGIKKRTDAKRLPREELIDIIISSTNARLRQGESFTKDS